MAGPDPKSPVVQAVVLVAVGCLVGVANNLAAGPTRKLEWVKDYPEPVPRAKAARPSGEGTTSGGAPSPSTAPETQPAAPAETSPAPSPSAGGDDLAGVEVPFPDPARPFVDVTPQQARKAWLEKALFIDARRTAAYEEGHVAGALSLSVWESGVEEKISQLVFELEGDLGRPVVVYCSGGDCVDSHALAEKLWESGHTRVLVFTDGYPAWTSNGWETTKGSAR